MKSTQLQAEEGAFDENDRREEFLATLGHEMRNPLSALSHALEVWPNWDPQQMEQLRAIMQRQVRQLLRLSDDLVDAARISQGKLQLRNEQVGLRQLIEDACEEVKPLIERRGHTLTVHIPDEPIVVSGDQSRLLQVFANLIQNAAKFTEPKGTLSISVGTRAGMAFVKFRDNGRGIEEHLLPFIFEPYSQVKDAFYPLNDGIGIGLRLVKSVVELHGGSVSVDSDGQDCGCEFTVQLPLATLTPGEATPDVPAAGAGTTASQRILVVDDCESAAELLARMLRHCGHEVVVAVDGVTAIRCVLEERPQVVLLDIVLDGMSGLTVAERLREHKELKGLVLIALSGNSDPDSRRRALEAGFDKYLVKPTSIAELVETLAELTTAK
ncbi:hybrid sensor histidine kinase/response regulator [Lignipirellula cremea]|uniref:hybrid sensor histidine kinase/response regulator n=1 Tax=Lignipirellula cremea TaxID=2528010 RepID=UPI0018D260CD|nr:hybrid sensor histidine kinase/response regulator [Lignipirellula cremea]